MHRAVLPTKNLLEVSVPVRGICSVGGFRDRAATARDGEKSDQAEGGAAGTDDFRNDRHVTLSSVQENDPIFPARSRFTEVYHRLRKQQRAPSWSTLIGRNVAEER